MSHLKIWTFKKILIAFGVIPNEFRGWGSKRRTICDQDQGYRTLHLGVRGQNEGKIGTFGCNTFLLGSKLPSILPKLWIMRIDSQFIIFQTLEPTISINFELQVTLTWVVVYLQLILKCMRDACYPRKWTKKVWGLIGISTKSTHGPHIMAVKWNLLARWVANLESYS